jgi:hypothetical protein
MRLITKYVVLLGDVLENFGLVKGQPDVAHGTQTVVNSSYVER